MILTLAAIYLAGAVLTGMATWVRGGRLRENLLLVILWPILWLVAGIVALVIRDE